MTVADRASRPSRVAGRSRARRASVVATALWSLTLTPLAAPAASADPLDWSPDRIPNAWSFESGVFTFSYSTAMADGHGNFPAGSETNIAVPAIQYPHGHTADVTGGHVVSDPNASVPVIASDGGGTVSVTVHPVSTG